MTKLLVLLLLGMYLVFQLGGSDPMQLRPGLADAGVNPSDFPKAVIEPVATRTLAATPEIRAARPTTAAVADTVPKVALPKRDVVTVAYAPDTTPTAPARQPDKVFTLSALPGQANAPVLPDPVAVTATATAEPQVWYVTGRSVNVRQDPSTDAPVVGKLNRGDAALVLADTGAGWAQITIEGDGVSGFVALDFLSQTAP
ncbi:MAG: SH3 domain-containing protein [Pseudomonadota bacterium]